MADTTDSNLTPPAADASGMPTGKKVAVVAAPAFTPAAGHIPPRPRDKFLESLANFTFGGRPKPELVDEVKRIAVTLANIAPCDKADQLEGRFEISGFTAHSVLVVVTPHNY